MPRPQGGGGGVTGDGGGCACLIRLQFYSGSCPDTAQQRSSGVAGCRKE